MDRNSASMLARAIFAEPPTENPGDLPAVRGYTLVREIGRGGGGVVYEGVSHTSGSRVAVKFMHERGRKPADRVFHEVDRLTEVRSGSVPHVYEHGWSAGRMFLVMELIEGLPLLEYADGFDLRERVELLVKVSGAVWDLNSHGIIHRDLKPSNILVTKQGMPVIVDLGIAMLLGGEGEGDEDAEPAMGTLAYMAPEQARGIRAEVTTRSDVYALGAIGYELLTGSTPNELSPTVTQTLRRLQKEPPRPARSLMPGLSAGLAYILEHACAFDPSERYGSAEQMRDDLQHWLRREPISVGPQTLWMRLTRQTIRHPVATVAVLCTFVAIASLSTISTMIWWQITQPYRFLLPANELGPIASIVSFSGRVLYSWQSVRDDGIVYRGLIRGPDGDRYAVIGFKHPELGTGVSGLVGYKLGEYEKPAWVAEQRVPDELMYAVQHQPRPHQFWVCDVFLFDVFSDIDGIELLSVHRDAKLSACVVQIRSADGTLLSEFAHDGELDSLYWEPMNGVLYCVGRNSDGEWMDRGEPENYPGRYPLVVFAVRPELGATGLVVQHPGIQGTIQPLWYSCLLPGSAYSAIDDSRGHIALSINKPGLPADLESGFFDLQLGGMDESEHLILVLDADGQVVRRRSTGSWERESGMDSDVFTLEALPPRVVPRKFEQ
ncbi:MAG: serine/threonine protein kinase [Phycisphaerales bacterium]|nr:serine/threonine protein kinase [Phycisphaerales bacterium]